MSSNTSIEWATHTWNPWWGCTRVSPGCANCYAADLGRRFGVKWGAGETRRAASMHVMNDPIRWDRQAKKASVRHRVFCGSMMDWADPEVDPALREMMWTVIRMCKNLDWLLLTKRPENIPVCLPPDWGKGWAHVGIGTTVENQDMANKRIQELLKVPAAMRFLSCEPLIGPVTFRWAGWIKYPSNTDGSSNHLDGLRGIDWVIAGGESGAKARPMHPDWARSLRDECRKAGVAFFFKQNGEYASVSEVAGPGAHHHFPDGATVRRVGKSAAGRLLDGIEWNQFPSPLPDTSPNPSNISSSSPSPTQKDIEP